MQVLLNPVYFEIFPGSASGAGIASVATAFTSYATMPPTFVVGGKGAFSFISRDAFGNVIPVDSELWLAKLVA